jgi:hypothetical protein
MLEIASTFTFEVKAFRGLKEQVEYLFDTRFNIGPRHSSYFQGKRKNRARSAEISLTCMISEVIDSSSFVLFAATCIHLQALSTLSVHNIFRILFMYARTPPLGE